MIEMTGALVERLRHHSEPYIRFKILTRVIGRAPDAREARIIRNDIPGTVHVKTLLAERDSAGRIPLAPDARWRGAHWVLACLADLDYPPGDRSLQPLMEQVWSWLLDAEYCGKMAARLVKGRYRSHASTDAHALLYALRLGLVDERIDVLVKRLLSWQWPDGGWNANLQPQETDSSVSDSLMPLRALTQHAQDTANPTSLEAAQGAAEFLLALRLYRRRDNGEVIHPDVMALRFPCYDKYDILSALKGMAEADLIRDPRCADALNLLESRQLQDSGFPADRKHYRVGRTGRGGDSLVDWGGASKRKMNEFVTADALYVLRAAGRLSLLGIR